MCFINFKLYNNGYLETRVKDLLMSFTRYIKINCHSSLYVYAHSWLVSMLLIDTVYIYIEMIMFFHIYIFHLKLIYPYPYSYQSCFNEIQLTAKTPLFQGAKKHQQSVLLDLWSPRLIGGPHLMTNSLQPLKVRANLSWATYDPISKFRWPHAHTHTHTETQDHTVGTWQLAHIQGCLQHPVVSWSQFLAFFFFASFRDLFDFWQKMPIGKNRFA